MMAYADNDNHTVEPVITVLTHRLGGAPEDWSNDSNSEEYKYNPSDLYYKEENDERLL